MATVAQRSSTTSNSVEKIAAIAKKRAEAGCNGGIFNGEEALAEVAKVDGTWNWALVGPDPVELPLSGGGRGGIEEMRDSIGKHAHSFGLLRIVFGVGTEAKKKFLFIHASDPIDSGNFSQVQRGKAMAVVSKMEQFMQAKIQYIAKIKLESQEDCTAEYVVGKINEVVRGMGSEGLTLDAYKAAWEFERKIHAAESIEKEKRQVEAKKVMEETKAAVAAVAAVPEMEPETKAEETQAKEEPKQRKRIKLFAIGDQVEVWSSKNNMWYMDAEVVDIAKETGAIDGLKIKAGSMKVVYDNGSRFKWVPPQQMEGYLRLSPRPKPPPPLTGNIFHATNGWWSTQWNSCYAELNRGFLQWWESQEAAKRGGLPVGKLHLRGFGCREQGNSLTLKSDSSGATTYNFKFDNPEITSQWVNQLWAHSGFCEEWADFSKAKQGGDDMRKQLMEKMILKKPDDPNSPPAE